MDYFQKYLNLLNAFLFINFETFFAGKLITMPYGQGPYKGNISRKIKKLLHHQSKIVSVRYFLIE